MSDDIERRVRRALHSAAPAMPAQPGYGERLDRLARRRRSRTRLAGGALSVVAVLGVVSGVTLASDPQSDLADDPPVASDSPGDPQVPAASCDTPTGPGTALSKAEVVEVRLCDGVALSGRGVRRRSTEVVAPEDTLTGPAAKEFVERIDAFQILRDGVDLDCPSSHLDFRFVTVAADGTTGQVLQNGSSCDMVTVDGEQRTRRALPTFLELLHSQRADRRTPVSTGARCPGREGGDGSTVGVDIPPPQDDGVTVLLCRHRSGTVRELRVSDPRERAEVLEQLGRGVDEGGMCGGMTAYPYRLDGDTVVVVDAWGDVLSASTFVCAPYPRPGSWDETGTPYGGGAVWYPSPELAATVSDLLER